MVPIKINRLVCVVVLLKVSLYSW